ncbi:MAG: HD-GYP domain-containing protein [Eubacteriaceae bacterium]
MKDNIKLNLNLFIMCALSILFCVYSFYKYPLIINTDIIIFIIFTIITESFVLVMSNSSAVTLSFGVILPVAVLFNPSVAILCIVLCNTFSVYKMEGKLKHIFNVEVYKTVFNVSNYIISCSIASYIYIYMNNGLGLGNNFISMIYMFISIIIYMISNIGFASIIMLLITDYDYITIIKNSFSSFIPNILGVGTVSILIVLAYINFGINAIIILLFPYLLIRYSFKLVYDMQETYISTIKALSSALEEKDSYTKGHSERVEKYSLLLAKAIDGKRLNIQQLQYAAIFHDIGKIGISDEILNKPGKLSNEEFDFIKEHPSKGVKILSNVAFLNKVTQIIGAHHEYCDGTGYPKGLRADEILLESKIITIADIYDAVTTDRPYRKAMTNDQAIDIIKSESGKKLDPELVRKFVELYEEGRLI